MRIIKCNVSLHCISRPQWHSCLCNVWLLITCMGSVATFIQARRQLLISFPCSPRYLFTEEDESCPHCTGDKGSQTSCHPHIASCLYDLEAARIASQSSSSHCIFVAQSRWSYHSVQGITMLGFLFFPILTHALSVGVEDVQRCLDFFSQPI